MYWFLIFFIDLQLSWENTKPWLVNGLEKNKKIKRKEKSKWKIQGIVGSKQSQPKKTHDRSAQPSITISTCIIIVATPFSFFPQKQYNYFYFTILQFQNSNQS